MNVQKFHKRYLATSHQLLIIFELRSTLQRILISYNFSVFLAKPNTYLNYFKKEIKRTIWIETNEGTKQF
ncbi:hypothetical protein BpHYR1_008575 [Brachionus plicatilis]|uniref:Uncharacterized protein n=1 Tax=Brachionus plicatilis TaxID=10195 RepID=A0A3M7QWB2_BRAPC|nr:hypothetical protein BpHYR1_008575 [Brachionus plicatilis]